MPASLSPAAQQAAASRKLDGNFSYKELYQTLSELERYDQTMEQTIQAAKTRFIWWVVGSVLGLFACILLLIVFAPLAILPLAILYFTIRAYRQWKALKTQDLSNDFRLCVKPVLETLGADLNPNEKIKTTLDLSGITDAKKKPPKELPPGRYQKLTETVIEDPWCSLRLPLLGGGVAEVEIRNDFRKLDRRYQSRRGKIKWKTKWVKDCSVTAMLIPAAPTEWGDQLRPPLDPATEKLKFVDKGGVRAPKLEHCYTYKGAGDPPAASPGPREVVGLLLRLQSLRVA